jgi:hypothetical protein
VITCLHTADVHVVTFGSLLQEAKHVVPADFLDRARAHGVASVADEVTVLLFKLAQLGPVLCTCSTLGHLVDFIGNDKIVRIDRPAMTAAVEQGGEVVVAICLDSTRAATLALFDEVQQVARPQNWCCVTRLGHFSSRAIWRALRVLLWHPWRYRERGSCWRRRRWRWLHPCLRRKALLFSPRQSRRHGRLRR